MKILHRGSDTEEEGTVPASAESPGDAPPAGLPIEGDPRSLHAMLDAIRKFRAGSMPLQGLVSELEFHLQALIMADHDWQSRFFGRWRELDRYQSVQMSSGGEALPPGASERIDRALEDLRHLIHNVLTGAGTGPSD